MTFFDRLMQRTEGYRSSSYGVSIDDFAKIPVSVDFGDEILGALECDVPRERRVGLFFCEGFVRSGRLRLLGDRLANALPEKLPRLIEDKDDLTRDAALPIFVLMRDQFPNYRQAMLRALMDRSSAVRTVALNAVDTFLKPREIEPLLSFEQDPYLSEIGGMGGPIHYVLRNQALETIERMVGRQFAKHELTEMVESEVVFWWDWKPMLEWYRASKTGVWAKLRGKLKSGNQ